MTNKSLAHRIDDFELELQYVSNLIELLYITPPDHEYFRKYIEDLHTHKINMHAHYHDRVRFDVLSQVCLT